MSVVFTANTVRPCKEKKLKFLPIYIAFGKMGLETLQMMFGDVLDRKEGLLDTYICIYVTKRFSLIAVLDFL